MAETDGNINGNGTNGGMAGVRPFILILGSIAAIISFLGGQAVVLHWMLVRPSEMAYVPRIDSLERQLQEERNKNNARSERIAYIEGRLSLMLGDSMP